MWSQRLGQQKLHQWLNKVHSSTKKSISSVAQKLVKTARKSCHLVQALEMDRTVMINNRKNELEHEHSNTTVLDYKETNCTHRTNKSMNLVIIILFCSGIGTNTNWRCTELGIALKLLWTQTNKVMTNGSILFCTFDYSFVWCPTGYSDLLPSMVTSRQARPYAVFELFK